MQNDGRLRLMNEISQKAQGLCIRAERGQRLRLARLRSFIGGQKIDTSSRFGRIACHPPAVDDVWNRAKSFVDLLEGFEYRRCGVPDRDRYILELGNIDVAGLQRSGR